MKKSTKSAVTATTPANPAPSPVEKVAVKKKPAKTAAPAPAVKATPASGVQTTIVASIDVGFGNALYIRGEGPGLSWETGIPLDCVADDKWSLVLSETARPVVFKLLLNDITWCGGEDFVAQPGSTVTVVPVF
jgi:hypothetical protein